MGTSFYRSLDIFSQSYAMLDNWYQNFLYQIVIQSDLNFNNDLNQVFIKKIWVITLVLWKNSFTKIFFLSISSSNIKIVEQSVQGGWRVTDRNKFENNLWSSLLHTKSWSSTAFDWVFGTISYPSLVKNSSRIFGRASPLAKCIANNLTDPNAKW